MYAVFFQAGHSPCTPHSSVQAGGLDAEDTAERIVIRDKISYYTLFDSIPSGRLVIQLPELMFCCNQRRYSTAMQRAGMDLWQQVVTATTLPAGAG